MFSITTIASSTTMPVASTTAKSVRVLIEKSRRFTNANADQRQLGMARAGINVARQLEEDEDHEHDEADSPRGASERLR